MSPNPIKLAQLRVAPEVMLDALHLPRGIKLAGLGYDEKTRSVTLVLTGDALPEGTEVGKGDLIAPTIEAIVTEHPHPEKPAVGYSTVLRIVDRFPAR